MPRNLDKCRLNKSSADTTNNKMHIIVELQLLYPTGVLWANNRFCTKKGKPILKNVV